MVERKVVVLLILAFLLFSVLPLSVSYAGTTWSFKTVDAAGNTGDYSSLALDSSGYPHISYYDRTNGDLKYAYQFLSALGYPVWALQTVDSAGDVGGYSSLALDSSGYPHISYHDGTNGDLKYARRTGSAWNIQTVDSAGDVGDYSSLALDSSGYPHISYQDSTNGDLKYARWSGSAWSIQTVDSAGFTGSHISLALDSSDYPHISYHDGTNRDLKYAYQFLSALGYPVWALQTVDSAGDVGAYSSLALDSSGNPCISYLDVNLWNLKYARRTGSSWSIQTAYSTGDVGMYSSLALDSSDYPHISCDYQNRFLFYVRWTGSAWAGEVVPAPAGYSAGPSLALDSSGNPCISYYDITNYDLMCAFGESVSPAGSIVVNGGAAFSTSTSVTLALTYTATGSTVDWVRYSNDGVWDTESWEAPSASKSWTLSSGDGAKNVYYQVKDSDGMVSSTYSDGITLDTTPPIGSITINSGASYTTSGSVTLSLTHADATSGVSQVRYSNDGVWDSEAWESPTASKSWTLTSGDGAKTVYFQVKDNAGLVSSTYSDTITLDTTVPTGSIVINNGDAFSASTSVTLSLTYADSTSGVSQVRYSNDGVWDTEAWETPAASKPWALTSGDGTKTVYYQVKDNAGLVSSTYSDTIVLSTSGPTGSIVINGGASYTSSTSATLSVTYSDPGSGVSGVRYSNDGVWDTESWESPAATKAWTLTSGDGTKTVYYQVKNVVEVVSPTYSDAIMLDTVAPTGSVVINNGDASTSSASVTLSLTYSDAASGVSQVRYSNDGVWDSESWEDPAASKSWSLTSGDGTKTVYYQIRDNAGLTSTTYSDTIALQSVDTTPPAGSIVINGGAATTSSASVTLTLSATDSESGVAQMRFSNDGSSWSSWETYVTSKPWTLTSGDGAKTVYAQFKNGAGLDSASYSDAITLQSADTIPPTGSIAINGGAATTSSVSVTLTLSAADNSGVVAQMRFANLDESWTAWEPYATSKAWTLTSGTGTKTVFAQFKDGSSLESVPYGDTILLEPFFEERAFNVSVGGSVYVVTTRSNSSVSDFSFNQVLKRIRFSINGTSGTTGVCNVTIPAALMSGDFSLFIDDVLLVKDVGYSQAYNGTHYLFSINYAHSVHMVEIVSSVVIPEFPAGMILPLLIALTLTAAGLLRKRKQT